MKRRMVLPLFRQCVPVVHAGDSFVLGVWMVGERTNSLTITLDPSQFTDSRIDPRVVIEVLPFSALYPTVEL